MGIGVAKDETKAYDLWADATEKGHRNSFRLCQTAAEAGHARGQYLLAQFYQDGIGIPVNISLALHWFQRSAEQNYAPAQCQLGVIHCNGELGLEKDPEAAVQWFRLAADQNDPGGRAWLARCCYLGVGVEQNKDEAARIWKELAQSSYHYPHGDPASQAELGRLLLCEGYNGYNPKEGVKWLRKSADQNHASAQTVLGILYYNGFGNVIKQNWNEARRLFREAAKQGNSESQYYLGEIFFDGNGVQMNRKEALRWYKRSSTAGYVGDSLLLPLTKKHRN